MTTYGGAVSGSKPRPPNAPSNCMDMMKHKHTCLIMAMMSYNNNNKTVNTELPEEMLQRIAGFIEGEESAAMCNAFGKLAEEFASFRCYRCERMMPYKDVRGYMGVLICADHEVDECDRIWKDGWDTCQANLTCEDSNRNSNESDTNTDTDEDAGEDEDPYVCHRCGRHMMVSDVAPTLWGTWVCIGVERFECRAIEDPNRNPADWTSEDEDEGEGEEEDEED